MKNEALDIYIRKTFKYDDYRKEIAKIMECNGKRIKITEILKQRKISNTPFFSDEEKESTESFLVCSELDDPGRAGVIVLYRKGLYNVLKTLPDRQGLICFRSL